MAKVINTILNLRDNMSKGLLAAARNTQGVTREMRTATREVINFKNKSSKAVTDATKKVAALGTAAVGAFGAFATKSGMDFEAQMSKVQAISGTVQTPTGGSSGEYCTMGASLMQPCRVYEEGLRVVKYFQRGGRHCG